MGVSGVNILSGLNVCVWAWGSSHVRRGGAGGVRLGGASGVRLGGASGVRLGVRLGGASGVRPPVPQLQYPSY